MEIARKIGDWAWVNKERLVLAVLVLFLAYRIYTVLNPSKIDEQTAQAAASASRATLENEDGTEAAPGGPRQNRLRRPGQGSGAAGEEGEGASDPEEAPIVFTQHKPPKPIQDPTNLPEDWEESEGRPPMPPANPLPPAPVAYNALVKDNPFTATKGGGTGGPGGPQKPPLTLLDIKPWGTDAYRALIQTRTRKWYEEGESFETYQLIAIDPDAGAVEIFSEQHGQTFTYTIGR